MNSWQPDSPSGLVRHIATVGISGIVTGLMVGGLGGRLFMRIAGATAPESAQGARTEAGFRVGEVTAAGTIELVVFVGIFVGIVGAVLFGVFRPWLSWAGRYRGAAFGVVLFALGNAASDILNPDNIDFVILGNGLLLVVMIVVLFIGFGVMMDGTYGVADRLLPTADVGHRLARFVYAILVALGFFIVTGLLSALVSSEGQCDCVAPKIAALFFVIATVGTALWWAIGMSARLDRARLTAQMLGTVGLAGAVVFGLIRAISDAVEVIS